MNICEIAPLSLLCISPTSTGTFPHVPCQLPLHPKSLSGLGAFAGGLLYSSVPVWTAFPYPLTRVRIPAASDYYAPSDSYKDIGVSFGLPLLYSPLPFPFLAGLPCSWQRTYLWMALRWRVLLRVPSPLWGSPSSS